MSACPPCNQKCNQGRDCLANKQGHEPSRTQTKQIVDGLQRCHHPDSQHEFLRTWIRDWTIHKTAPREWVGLTDEESVSLLVKANKPKVKGQQFTTAPEMAAEFGRLVSELLKERNT